MKFSLSQYHTSLPPAPSLKSLPILFLHQRLGTMVRSSYWQTEFAQISTHLCNSSFSSACSRKLQQTPARSTLPLTELIVSMADQEYEQTPDHLALVLYQGPRITPLYSQPGSRFLNNRPRWLERAQRQGLRTSSRPWPPFANLEDLRLRARRRPRRFLALLQTVFHRAQLRHEPLRDRLVRDFMEEYQRQQLLSAALPARAAIETTTCQACSGKINSSSDIVLDCGHGYHKDCLAWSYMLAMIKILEDKYATPQLNHD